MRVGHAQTANHVQRQTQLRITGERSNLSLFTIISLVGHLVSLGVLTQVSAASLPCHRSNRFIVTAEQQYKGVGRGGYPQDEEKASQLRTVADKMDAFFASSDEAAFNAVASPDITLHADLLILDNDLSGSDKVKQTLGTYTKNFEYKHENIAHGADIDGSSVFHFWLHQVKLHLCSTKL